jgi:hypothetical protein
MERTVDRITIKTDMRILTVFALFNSVYSYDEELGEQMSHERQTMRDHCKKLLQRKSKTMTEGWKRYHDEHQHHIWAYLYYSLTRNEHDFRCTEVGRDAIWPKLREVVDGLRGFDQIMSEFYELCRIAELFEKIEPKWIQEVQGYDIDRVRSGIAKVHTFLRVEPGNEPMVNIVPTPFDSHFSAYGAPFKDRFYTLDGPGTAGSGMNTHEYLHLFVNTIEFGNLLRIAHSAYEKVKGLASVKENYSDPVSFLQENLVRATDYSVWRVDQAKLEGFLADDESNGLILVRRFYEQLRVYPETDTSFSDYVRRVVFGCENNAV